MNSSNLSYQFMIFRHKIKPRGGEALRAGHRPPSAHRDQEGPQQGQSGITKVSRSYVKVHYKTIRMRMRRFTRLASGHSKKVTNHARMAALYTMFYKSIRTHGKLPMSPTMAAGIAFKFLSFENVLARIGHGSDC
jgi:hypothetical protein